MFGLFQFGIGTRQFLCFLLQRLLGLLALGDVDDDRTRLYNLSIGVPHRIDRETDPYQTAVGVANL